MGPKGTGFLYVRKELMEVVEPFWVGGGSDSGWDLARGGVSFRKDAHRFDFGSQSAPLSAGLGAAIDFISRIGIENVSLRGRRLADLLRAELATLGDRVEILTPDEGEGRASIVGFRLKNLPFDKLQSYLLEQHRIVTRMVPENGVNCNRVSTHIYNAEAEVHRLTEAIKKVA
jgi:selenocysteine lyase/cysteine desulfurase